MATILFIPFSSGQINLETAWAADCAEVILRRCPVCERDSIIGHGRRRKQAHDEHHDWIEIRRGICNCCGKTFTFLPPFSLPYTHYSLLARSQATRHYFVERCSLESAAPTVLDSGRVADPSTLRRWFRSLDCSQPSFPFLRQTLDAVTQFLARGEMIHHDALPLSWPTLVAPYDCFGPCASKKFLPPTILAWESGLLPRSLDSGRKRPHGPGLGTTQTASATAGVLAAAQLDPAPP